MLSALLQGWGWGGGHVHSVLFSDITVVICDLCGFISQNENERKYRRNIVTKMEHSNNILFMLHSSESENKRQNIKLVSASSVFPVAFSRIGLIQLRPIRL